MIETGLTDREKESLLKFFLTHGELLKNDDDTYTWKFYRDAVFMPFEKDFVDILIKAMDNLRKSGIESMLKMIGEK